VIQMNETDQHEATVTALPQPQQGMDPQVAEWMEKAQQDEQMAAQEAALGHLQSRVVALNVEVRARDHQIALLERQKAALEARLDAMLAQDPSEVPEVPQTGEQPD